MPPAEFGRRSGRTLPEADFHSLMGGRPNRPTTRWPGRAAMGTRGGGGSATTRRGVETDSYRSGANGLFERPPLRPSASSPARGRGRVFDHGSPLHQAELGGSGHGAELGVHLD